MEQIMTKWRGVALAVLIAVPAYFLGTLLPVVGGPVFAILIGMVIGALVKNKAPVAPGMGFTSKYVLQTAIVLLGFSMDLRQVAAVGRDSLPIICVTIGTALVVAYILYRAMKVPEKSAILVGVGSSICGGSAIAATAPVIGADDDEIAQSISVIFLFNIIAALVFPTIGGLLGMTDNGFALFAGTAVNDTSSVTAAAAAWDGIHGGDALSGAAITKMTRTLAIIPITLVLSVVFARRNRQDKRNSISITKIFPWFVLLFLIASLVTTIFQLPAVITDPLKLLSKFFIIMAMAAIGFNTDIVKLVKTGAKPIVLGLVCWICIACASLLMQHVMGFW
ncbi:MAG: YeiH family protein [Anaerovoracaceae bacterium]|jgi:uncharacterized integral membrane protein (TIGR00698 family)